MRTLTPALAIVALIGFCGQANAQAQCPELTRLLFEAGWRTAIADRCEAYIRASLAWGALVEYANGHRESCDVSGLSNFEKYRHNAAIARDNACTGRRPVRPFPPEIVPAQQHSFERPPCPNVLACSH